MSVTDRLGEIQARADATPGQVWRLVHETPTAEEAIVMGDARAFLAGIEFQHEDDPDPTFIEPEYLPESYHRFAVHARADVPRLVAALRAVDEVSRLHRSRLPKASRCNCLACQSWRAIEAALGEGQ